MSAVPALSAHCPSLHRPLPSQWYRNYYEMSPLNIAYFDSGNKYNVLPKLISADKEYVGRATEEESAAQQITDCSIQQKHIALAANPSCFHCCAYCQNICDRTCSRQARQWYRHTSKRYPVLWIYRWAQLILQKFFIWLHLPEYSLTRTWTEWLECFIPRNHYMFPTTRTFRSYFYARRTFSVLCAVPKFAFGSSTRL